MSTEFAIFMAKQDNSFYPLRFMSADFFVPYWKCFIPNPVDPAHVHKAQLAARASGDYSMANHEIYWNIDHSEKHALATWDLFDKLTGSISPEPLRHIRTMAIQLAVSTEESASTDYVMNLMTRLSHDREFRSAVGCSDADADVIAAANENSTATLVDIDEVIDGWLASKTSWDLRLKAQTPDLEESVALIFAMAYGPRTALPRIQQNLRDLLETDAAYRSFIVRFERVFKRSLSETIMITFPVVLRLQGA